MGHAGDGQTRDGWFDLSSTRLVALDRICPTLNASLPPADAPAHLGDASCPVGIWFDKFSDGRGFTLARYLREKARFTDALLADGHLIPDQAYYLRRCGFSHDRIREDQAAQWRRSLALAPPSMQQVLASRRERGRHDPSARLNQVE
jgi:uncharacterized protein (DUF934 family)